MSATLFVIPGSHPAMAVRRMLELKRIAYRRVDLLPVVSRGVLKAMRFPGVTVPALKLGGERITGSREIARRLDELYPEPPLWPTGQDSRLAVEAAESWAGETLQPTIRRILWAALSRDSKPIASFAEGARLGIPPKLAARAAAPIVAAERRIHGIDDERVRDDLASLPSWLDRIDLLIGQGALSAPDDLSSPNVADLMVGSSVRLAMTLDDLRGPIAARPAGRQAMALFPEFPGRIGPVLPAAWLGAAGPAQPVSGGPESTTS